MPYTSADEVAVLVDSHMAHVVKLVRSGPFGLACQALLLLYQVTGSRGTVGWGGYMGQ